MGRGGVGLDAFLSGGVAWAGVALSSSGDLRALSSRGVLRRRTSPVLELLRGDLRIGVTWAGGFAFREDFRTGAAFARTGTKLMAPCEFSSDTLNHRPDFLTTVAHS